MRRRYDPFRHGDWERLGRDVGRAVEEAARGFRRAVEENRPPQTPPPAPEEGPETPAAPSVSEAPLETRPGRPGKVSGLVFTVLGLCGGVPLLALDGMMLALFLTGFLSAAVYAVTCSFLGILTALFVAFFVWGRTLSRNARRFLRYCAALGAVDFMPVKDLAAASGESPRRVVRSLAFMIRRRWFLQAHLNEEKDCFFINDATYTAYLSACAQEEIDRQKEAERKAREEKARAESEADPEKAKLEAFRREGEAYLLEIREANDALPGEEVSLKLYRLEAATAQILTQVERYPEKLPQVRRLIQYYLPTTLKLVKAYCSFETEHARGTEIEKTKQEILQALDTINAAFETLLKRLYEHEALDLSSDIAALEAMLAQEGLTGSDFSKT